MKVQVKELIKLLKFANVHTKGLDKGKKVQLISDAMLTGENGKLRIIACPNSGNIHYDIGIPAIVEGLEKIPVSDIKDFIKFLAIFEGEIELTLDENNILVTDSSVNAIFKTTRTINAVLGLTNNGGKIHNDNEFMGYGTVENYNVSYAITDPSYIAKVIKKTSDSLGIYDHKFEIGDDDLFIKCRNSNKGDIISAIQCEVFGEPTHGTYSIGVDHVFNFMEDEVILYMGLNKPMVITDSSGNVVVLFAIKGQA